jgi:ribosomal protein S18 acetylase RimI-like enzyme
VSDTERLVHLQLADPGAALGQLDRRPPAGIHLRAADLPADLPLIAELYNAIFAPDEAPRGSKAERSAAAGRSADPGQVTIQEFARLTQHPGISPTGMFLAFAGEQAVGLAVSKIDVPAPGGADHRGAIELLGVRTGFRRRGIGRALIRAALGWLVERGVQQVSASAANPIVPDMLSRYGFRRIEQS